MGQPVVEGSYPIWEMRIELGTSVSLQFSSYTLKLYLVAIGTSLDVCVIPLLIRFHT